MRYIICAKEEFSGDSTSDFADPKVVTEIATELIYTRLYCIMKLKEGVISKNDTVVTASDRLCLYDKIFDNVISWGDFKKLNVAVEYKLDLLEPSIHNSIATTPPSNSVLPFLPFYRNWERDKNEITNISLSPLDRYDTSKEFVCLLIRLRGAWPEKNLSKDYWVNLIRDFESKGIKVFVFGKETESYATEKTQNIPTFQEWCSIINHENCKAVISTVSGGVYPVFILGSPEMRLIIIDNLNLYESHPWDPTWYNDCINFSKVKKTIITHIPTIDQLLEVFNNDL
tara:strand:- start:340 stop:1194 length:855 start_codon:yes stop_codon:yes gene_type:complete